MTDPPPGGGDEDPGRQNFANLVALIAVAILVALGYWAFTALEHSRHFQQCLDSGRRNCVDDLNPGR